MTNIKEIPEEIKEYLSYDELTGDLTWIKKPSDRVKIGTIAGSINSYGYAVVKFKGIHYKAHRIVWFLKTGEQPPKQIDHRDTIKSNNIWTNLREATPNQNQHNTSKYKNNKSGYKGVSWNKIRGKWSAYIKLNSKATNLGAYDTPEEAYLVYCSAAEELHGKFSNVT